MSERVPGLKMSPTSQSWQDYIVNEARRCARSKTQNWPGMPVSQLPLATVRDLDILREQGRVVIMERPSKTRPDRIAAYIVATATSE